MTYDDGSTIEIDSAGTSWATDISGNTVSAVTTGGAYFAGDVQENRKLSQFYPNNGKKLDENIATYGATRAIDAAFALLTRNKTETGATYAGQNGKTYATSSASNRSPKSLDGGSDEIMLLVLAGAAFFALS